MRAHGIVVHPPLLDDRPRLFEREEDLPIDQTLRAWGQKLGATPFIRGEGIWKAGDQVVFTATMGGRLRRGQVFSFLADRKGFSQELRCLTGRLALPWEKGNARLVAPDNLTLYPGGQASLERPVFIAEDPIQLVARVQASRIIVIDPTGKQWAFARNHFSGGEIAGLCFSPDGKILFANLLKDGITLAIQGPFAEYLRDPGAYS